MIKTLLVPVDGSELAERAMRTSIEFAQQLAGAIVGFIVEPPVPHPSRGLGAMRYLGEVEAHNAEKARHADAVLRDFGERAKAKGVPFEGAYVQTAEVDEAIASAARQRRCDMIVMVTHGRGAFGELLFGSHTKAVMARSRLPLLVVH
jgi:nucleotide-binding universal stress UspA family protein